MTITAEGATKALFILDACNLNAAKQGQARVWAEIIAEALPRADDADLMDAIKRLARQRNSESKGGTWVTPGDVIAEIRKARNDRIDRSARQIANTPPDDGTGARKAFAAVRAAKEAS